MRSDMKEIQKKIPVLFLSVVFAVSALLAVSCTAIAGGASADKDTDTNSGGGSSSAPVIVASDYGAQLEYSVFEAEDCLYTGTLISGSRTWGRTASEAGGRKAVKVVSSSQQIQFTSTAAVQGITVRYSVPDSAGGSDSSVYTCLLDIYAGDEKAGTVTLTNKYSWIYGTYDSIGDGHTRWSNSPSATPQNPHRFFDEVHALLSKEYSAGTVFTLKPASGCRTEVTIDFIETEAVGNAKTMPSNYVSITEYGAAADDGIDDTSALTSAIAAVKASSSLKGVWIPEGTFNLSTGTKGAGYDGTGTRIYLSGVSIKGAGMWRSVLAGAYAGIFVTNGNLTLSDFCLEAEDTIRDDTNGVSGIEGDLSGCTIDHVWIEHTKVGLWSTASSNFTAKNCRFRNTWADGVNLYMGTTNADVENCSIRNTGDDGMAMWSYSKNDSGNTFKRNTVQCPNLANGIAVYGGSNNTVTENLIEDTVDNGAGISFGTDFTPPSFSGTLTVTKNRLVRCGSYHHDYLYGIGAVWGLFKNSSGIISGPVITVTDNTIEDSTYAAFYVECNAAGAAMDFTDNAVVGAGTYAVEISSSASGRATLSGTAYTNCTYGKLMNKSNGNFTIVWAASR